jgi:hypothetical protein
MSFCSLTLRLGGPGQDDARKLLVVPVEVMIAGQLDSLDT